MPSTGAVSGLASGLDWRKVIDQMRQLEGRKLNLSAGQKKDFQSQAAAWQGINSKLLSLKTKAESLRLPAGFNVYTPSLLSNTSAKPEDILQVAAGEEASPGSYTLKVLALAENHKISSTGFASRTEALGLSGDLVVGGRTVKIAPSESLTAIRDKINAANAGARPSRVSAAIVNYGADGFRLILSGEGGGAQGISLANGGSADLTGLMGFVDGSPKTVKDAVSGAHRSDAFSASDKAIGTALLNLSTPAGGLVEITIGGISRSVAIDLAVDSLDTIKASINDAFQGALATNPASVMILRDDKGNASHRLVIAGSGISYSDSGNVLETIGILKRAGFSDERGMAGDLANTSGGRAIKSSTRIRDIDGYSNHAPGDSIAFGGKNTAGEEVNILFSIEEETTMGDLLGAIRNAYGDVTPTVTAAGKIMVINNEQGDGDLRVILTPSNGSLKFASSHDLGANSNIRARELQKGADAVITLDGVTISHFSNLMDRVIPGVSLNLKKADPETAVTIRFQRDNAALMKKIEDFATAYNEALETINSQLAYRPDQEKQNSLYGDSSLKTIRSNLGQLVLQKVPGAPENFSTLGMAGIRLGKDGKLAVDKDRLEKNLENNFEDIKKLFSVNTTSTNSAVTYIYHDRETKAGTYRLNIDGVNPLAGSFIGAGERVSEATAKDEYLKGISGDARGLLVRYSGQVAGTVGEITLTFGIAELFDRSLANLTDSYWGSITKKNNSIQNRIDRLDRNMSDMERRIDQRMVEMERRFVAMESALSAIQSQSDWLSGQIGAISRGWR